MNRRNLFPKRESLCNFWGCLQLVQKLANCSMTHGPDIALLGELAPGQKHQGSVPPGCCYQLMQLRSKHVSSSYPIHLFRLNHHFTFEKSSNTKLQELTCVSYYLNLPERQLLLYLPPQGQAASACWECQPGRTTEVSSPGRGTGEGAAHPVSGEEVGLCACPGCLDEFLLSLAQCRMCYKEKKTASLPPSCLSSLGTQPLLQTAVRSEARSMSPLPIAQALLGR